MIIIKRNPNYVPITRFGFQSSICTAYYFSPYEHTYAYFFTFSSAFYKNRERNLHRARENCALCGRVALLFSPFPPPLENHASTRAIPQRVSVYGQDFLL